jgi:hypothetical protein
MAQNPLQKFFRQPKIFVNLPSQGVYNKPGTLQGDVSNMPVYGMTGMDEIIVKTPDALMTGQSTATILESCCPYVKDAWDLSTIDTPLLFAAIRIATYGNTITINHSCPKCTELHDYDLDLTRVVEHYTSCKYDNTLVLKDLVIKTQPLTYKQRTEFNIKNFQLQQKLTQIEKIEDSTEQQEHYVSLFNELAGVQKELYSASIESVEVGTSVVTERSFIDEWMNNCDGEVFDAIKSHIEANQIKWTMPLFPIVCVNDACKHEMNLSIELDYANFFVKA